MKANRSRDTGPERVLRSQLCRLGVSGYRIAPSIIPGRPDVTFMRKRIAVFVNGCFWHRHECSPDIAKLPSTNRTYWVAKFSSNVARDRRKVRALRSMGWSVLTVWECRLAANPAREARRVVRAVFRKSFLRGQLDIPR